MIKRHLEAQIISHLEKRKAILLFGARQVGKTTLVKSVCKIAGYKSLFLNGDESEVHELLNELSSVKLKLLFGDNKIIVIDEAQNIQNIGTLLKIIVDMIPEVQVIATGSSAFELANKANEPLTGRKYEFMLYPLSFSEMLNTHGFLKEYSMIEHRMLYGYYPEIVTKEGQEEKHLKILSGSYLYKDLLMLEQIKMPKLIEKILKALALQIGNEVNYNELAQLTGANNTTIEKYIDLMEQAYIIFKLPALSRNVRNEIKKGKKIYFYDNGIRNAVIGNFLPLHSRSDVGALWENFLVSERMKYLRYNEMTAHSYFWRTTQQQEIDYIEEQNGKIYAYEFKWNDLKTHRIAKTFSDAYHPESFEVISLKTIESFLCPTHGIIR